MSYNENMTLLIFVCFLIMIASLGGAVFSARWIEKRMNYLLSFSSGVFLIIAIQLFLEATEHSPSLIFGLGFIGLGIVGLALADYLIPEGHHHHTDEECHDPHTLRGARKMLIGDGIHNIGDGIVLASAFGISPIVGFTTAIGIFVHELVQEISEFFVLTQTGYTKNQALVRNFIASATILIGAFGGYYLSSFENLEGPIVSIAAGAFIYIVLKDILPHSIRRTINDKQYTRHIFFFGVGLALILILSLLLGEH